MSPGFDSKKVNISKYTDQSELTFLHTFLELNPKEIKSRFTFNAKTVGLLRL